MTEKLKACPFCGGEARTFEYDGANQATCGGKHIDCAGTDVVAPVAMWNHRTPAPEGEAWRTVPVEPTKAMQNEGVNAASDHFGWADEGQIKTILAGGWLREAGAYGGRVTATLDAANKTQAALTGEDAPGLPTSQNTEPGLPFSDAGEP